MNTQTTPQPFQRCAVPDHYKKGRDFEHYVIQLFNKDNFHLHEWRRSEKIYNITLLQDCANPDLELFFGTKKKYHFAVECKWRNGFKDGKIKWASPSQIKSYQDFENRLRIPVFIVIGVGGEPSKPERLFVTPLRNLELHIEIYEAELIPYKRKPTSRFFFDTVQLKLF